MVYDKPEFPHQLYVVDLKLADGAWDESFIRAHFNEVDADLILRLPSGNWGVEDKVMWHYTKHGEYSVSSGYRLAHDMREACHSWLPTSHALSKRGIQVAPMCSRCKGDQIEDVSHVLWGCPKSKEVWKCGGLWDVIQKAQSNDVLLTFQEIQKVCSSSSFEYVVVVSRHLWSLRNRFIHGGCLPRAGDILEWCGKYIHDFQQGMVHKTEGPERMTQKWEQPPGGCFVVNVDAGFSLQGDGAATGVVLRDGAGAVRFAAATVVRYASSPLVAELLAIRDGITAAIQRRVSLFEVRSDCLQAVRLINGAEVGCRQEDGLIVEIQSLLQHRSVTGVRFVYREANVVAHILANYTLSNKVSAMWIGVSPPCARQAIERDLPFPCNRLIV
uniref:RNase H type-1 domain-containing protein n=1 Tax=Cannabis sativa TaxID=3483 RepID=A0A803NG60_CANSA